MLWTLLKKLPVITGIILILTLCCIIMTLQLNLSAGVSDDFSGGQGGPAPVTGTTEPDYGADYCAHINQPGPGNPFAGWPAEDPFFHNDAFITMFFCDPNYGQTWEHEGLDLGFFVGSAIVATADAYIIQAGYDDLLGNMVVLCSGEWCARYGHMESLAVSINDGFVTRGQVIGYTGATGNAFGVHLHYDIFNPDGFWDPYPTLN